MNEQERLGLATRPETADIFYDFSHPVWRCPECGNLNRFANTFGEMCLYCHKDMTLGFAWIEHIVNPEVKTEWIKDA